MAKLYDIKHNGFPVGQKKGKNNAVKALKHYLAFEGIAENKQTWQTTYGVIIVGDNDGDVYSIEEYKGI